MLSPAVRRRVFGAAVLVISAILLSGCGKGTRPLVLQLKWIYNAGFAGDLVAYEARKDSLRVNAGGVGIDPVKQVLSGQAQFGVATGDQLLQAIAQGSPVVAIALVYQQNPLAWITANESISRPQDLKGKKVGLTYVDDEPAFLAMLKAAGIEKRDVTIVPVGFDVTPFTRGEVDAFPVYRNTQGVQLALDAQRRGLRTRFISPSDVGVVSYSNLYFTSKAMLQQHPMEVVRFLRAIRKAWEQVREAPSIAAGIVRKYDKETDSLAVIASVNATVSLVFPPSSAEFGAMDNSGWERTQSVLLSASVLKSRIEPDSVYTLEYLNQAKNP